MIIIVEGIDRVGKTTLCNLINDVFDIKTHKYKGIVEYKNMNNLEETDKTLGLFQLAIETDIDIVFDRAYMSDYVYGIIDRNYSPLEASKNLKVIEDFICKNNDKFILIMIKPENIDKSNKEHGKDLSKHEILFEDLFKESKINNKALFSYSSLNEALNYIDKIFEAEGIYWLVRKE